MNPHAGHSMMPIDPQRRSGSDESGASLSGWQTAFQGNDGQVAVEYPGGNFQPAIRVARSCAAQSDAIGLVDRL